jgi:hypothetical protein
MPYNSVLLLAKKHSRSVFSACIPIAGGNCRSAVHFLTKHRGSLVSEGFGGDPWPLILLTLCLVLHRGSHKPVACARSPYQSTVVDKIVVLCALRQVDLASLRPLVQAGYGGLHSQTIC